MKYICNEDYSTLKDTYQEAQDAKKKNLTARNLSGPKKDFKGKDLNNKKKGNFQKDTLAVKNQDRQGNCKSIHFNCAVLVQDPNKEATSATNATTSNNKDDLLVYPFTFKSLSYKLLLDTQSQKVPVVIDFC